MLRKTLLLIFFFWDEQSKGVLIRHQWDVTHMRKGQIQKHYALKLSSIIESTKSKKFKFLSPLSTTLRPYNILRKWSLNSWKGIALSSKLHQFLSFEVAHQIAKGTIFQTLWTLLFFILLLQATNLSFTLGGWTYPNPMNSRYKCQTKETDQ